MNTGKHSKAIKLLFFSLLGIIIISIIIMGFKPKNSLVGTWRKRTIDGSYEYITFNKDKTFDSDTLYKSIPGFETIRIKYNIVNKEGYGEIYIVFHDTAKPIKLLPGMEMIDVYKIQYPLGIYKLENGNLITRNAIPKYKMKKGVNIGISHYDIPKDFYGHIDIYEKVK